MTITFIDLKTHYNMDYEVRRLKNDKIRYLPTGDTPVVLPRRLNQAKTRDLKVMIHVFLVLCYEITFSYTLFLHLVILSTPLCCCSDFRVRCCWSMEGNCWSAIPSVGASTIGPGDMVNGFALH